MCSHSPKAIPSSLAAPRRPLLVWRSSRRTSGSWFGPPPALPHRVGLPTPDDPGYTCNEYYEVAKKGHIQDTKTANDQLGTVLSLPFNNTLNNEHPGNNEYKK